MEAKKTLFVEIEFSNREDGTIFKEYEITNSALLDSLSRDDFQALDFLEDQEEEVSVCLNWEAFEKSFIDRLAELIYQSKISEQQSESFLITIKDLGEVIWKFNSTDRLNFCMKIWSLRVDSYNQGVGYAYNQISGGLDKALESTSTSIKLSETKERIKRRDAMRLEDYRNRNRR